MRLVLGNRGLLGHLDQVCGLAKSLLELLLVEELWLALHKRVRLMLVHAHLWLLMVVHQIYQL